MCAQNCGNERKVRNAQTAECTSVSLNKSIILDMNLLTKRIFDHIYRCHVKKLIAEAQSVPLLLLTWKGNSMTADMFPYLYGYNAQLWHNFIPCAFTKWGQGCQGNHFTKDPGFEPFRAYRMS